MHFTYAALESGELQQGDLLKRTPEFDNVIMKFHPYYSAKADYTHFLILTQSCDLVRRDGVHCASQYISLAAVRPLYVAIGREAAPYKRNPLLLKANAISDKHKRRLEMFLEKLLNNNDKEYFYLHEEPTIGLLSSCAFLRLAISLRAEEHYESCKRARVLALSNEFRAKLGWLVGNIFARVGTQDWESNKLRKKVGEILAENLVLIDEQKIKATTVTEEQLESMTPEEVVQLIESSKSVKRKDQVIEAILVELRDGKFIKASEIEDMKKVLTLAPTVNAYFKS